MSSIQDRGDKWVAEIRRRNAKYISKTFLKKADARIWADEQERIIGGRKGLVLGKTFGQAMRRYAEEITPAKKGARWEGIRLTKLQRDDIANIPIADIASSDLQDWIGRQSGLKGSSINRELNLLSAVLTVARKRWKWLNTHPMADVERPSNPASRDKTYSDAQIDDILKALGYVGEVRNQRHKIAVAVLLSLETAMRQGELFGLAWERVNLAGRYASLPETKNGSKRDVPLSGKAIKLFNSLPRDADRVFPFPQASAATIYKRALVMAGIAGYTWHDLRHSAITRLADKLEMLDLARMVGHRDPRSLAIYYNPKPHDIAKKLD